MFKTLALLLILSTVASADTPPIIDIFKMKGESRTGVIRSDNGVISEVAPGSTGNVLTSNGTTWTSSPTPATGVTSVTASSPLSSSGGTAPNLSCQSASGSQAGCLSSLDWGTFNAKEPAISSGTTGQYWRGDKTFQALDKSAVGLSNVDNTSDASKPVSIATQTVLNAKEPTISAGTTLQYWRGDKTFQTLDTSAVPENGRLYYSDSLARGAVSASSPLTYSSLTGAFGCQSSSGSQAGCLSSSDWSTFNSKQSALSFSSPLSNSSGTVSIDLSAYAPLASPALTGVPTAPTASLGTSTSQVATTAFVMSQGFLGAAGSMPSATATSTTPVTSATTTFVTAITTSITVTAASAPVYAVCALDLTSATAASVANARVTINGTSGQTVSESLTTATTQHLTISPEAISTSLAAGTYTVTCDIARASGTGTVTFGQGTLAAIALQGSSSNGITSLSGLGLSAGPGSGAQSLTGILTLAGGGTNASLTAANGAIPYSTASALALLAPGSAGQILRSGGAGAPTWTSETFPASTTINQILYSSAANVVSGLATANTGALVTSSTGVPSITSGATANRVLRTNGTTVSFSQVALATDVSGTLPVGNGGTGLTTVASQRIPFGTGGSALSTDGNLIYDSVNGQFTVGGSGSARINAVVSSGSKTALQAFNSSGGNALQATNVSGWTSALINRSSGSLSGASISMEFGHGTPASPSGALSGDQVGVIAGLPDASDGNAYGYSGAISFVAAENATTSATGGDLVLSTTPISAVVPVERVRITNDGLVKSKNGFMNDTSGAQPSCDAGHRGMTWVVQGGAGVADLFQVCLKDAADAYSWVTK